MISFYAPTLGLRRRGSRWSGVCPFHPEQAPSFVVFEDKRFHCFGCQAHGDAVDFVSTLLGISSLEAAKRIGVDFGLLRSSGRTRHRPNPAVLEEQQLARAFKDKANAVYQDLCLLFRALHRIRPHNMKEVPGLVADVGFIEHVLDLLSSRDPEEQVHGWRLSRRWLPW
ncbi:MAG: CHC2 zinc finger domain-containing protein [Bacillota bacterium]